MLVATTTLPFFPAPAMIENLLVLLIEAILQS
jgi:hypothetical protein